jgi:hypothetical protein
MDEVDILKVTLNFVDETPSLEDSYATSSAPEPRRSQSRSSARQLRAIHAIYSQARESSYVTSRIDSEAGTPTPSRRFTRASSPSAINQRIVKIIEQAETNESAPPEHSIAASNEDENYEGSATLEDIPQEATTHWLPRSYDLPFANASESIVSFNEPLVESIEHQNENCEESEYWPYMTVQETYLMRYFIDKLACWVSYAWISGAMG